MKHTFLFLASFFTICSSVAQQRSFSGKPKYNILTVRAGSDTLGTTTVELFPAIAPNHVANFDSLVSEQFYDSTAFHRVIPGFMIQGGDPNSRSGPISTWGMGDSTQPTVNAEFSAARHERGILSAARDTDINSANSQFFICVAAAPWLNGNYSVYGKVVSGMDVVDTIVNAPRDINDNPFQKIEMFISYIGSNDSVPVAPLLTTPLSGTISASSGRTLKWATVGDAIMYHVEVSTDSLFSTLFKSVDVGTNQYTVTGLVAGNTYYWRVFTNNGGHTSGYSDVWNFYVSATGVNDPADAPTIDVFPNPTSGMITCTNLPGDSQVEVYDVTGRLLISKSTEGTTAQLDLTAQKPGLYFYTIISAGNKVMTGKLVLR